MNSAITGKPDVAKREVAIVNHLRENPEGATARELYEAVSEKLGDTISRPAYYKLLDRLVVSGKIDQIDDAQGARRYLISPQLHVTNRITLDDVYEMLPFVESTETMARAIDAQEYFYEHRHTVIRETAYALTEEPAVEVFFRWIDDLLSTIQADLDLYHLVEQEGVHQGQQVFADASLERRLQHQCEILREILYRHLSIPHEAVDISEWEGPHGLKRLGRFFYNPSRLAETLKARVFGIGEQETVLGLIKVDEPTLVSAAQDMIISGSDGSFHAGTMGIRTAQGFVEDESFVVTFNNSVAYIRSSERMTKQKGDKKYLHSAPVTRQTLDDPTYKGMVLAPFMFPMLTASEYEHMARTASDVVQMRVDDEVFNGKARDLATGEQIMPPRVHIRDGTITPQERGFNHYIQMNPYGDIAREGIARSRSILQRIATAQRHPQIYAGCVKSTQLRLFSRFINWYIAKGSGLTRGEPIEPGWDIERAGFISDIDVMTVLLANEAVPPAPNQFWMSCIVLRQFASLTDFYAQRIGNERTWLSFLKEMRGNAVSTYDKYGGEMPYHVLISEADLAEDAYLYMLEHGDYASFYVGHTWGEPPPKIPRYEFLCFRESDTDHVKQHIARTVEQIATALLTCQFSQDRDHNFLSRVTLTKLIPSVVYMAHEFAKQLGKKLETDYKSVVIARLAARRNQRMEERDIEIQPMSVRRYIQRFVDARKALPPPEQDADER